MRLVEVDLLSDWNFVTRLGEHHANASAAGPNRSDGILDLLPWWISEHLARRSAHVISLAHVREAAGHATLREAMAGAVGETAVLVAVGLAFLLILSACMCSFTSRRGAGGQPSADKRAASSSQRLTAEALICASTTQDRPASGNLGAGGYAAAGRPPPSSTSVSSRATTARAYVGKSLSLRCRSMSRTPTMGNQDTQVSRVCTQQSARQPSKSAGVHYAVQVSTLAEVCPFACSQGAATFRIMGMRGSESLSTTWRQIPGVAHTLEVSGEGDMQGAFVRVVAPIRPREGPDIPSSLLAFKLFGQGDREIGKQELQENGCWHIAVEHQPTLVIDGGETDLDLCIKTESGRDAATVSCNGHMGGEEHVVVSIQTGFQAVTIVACTLAVLVFGEDDIS